MAYHLTPGIYTYRARQLKLDTPGNLQMAQETLTKNSPSSKYTLYYDGTCPLCAKEITLLKRLTKNKILFVDIHQLKRKDNSVPSTEVLLRRLHLQSNSGEWLVGLDATVKVWGYTPYRWLFRILRWPFINSFSNFIYMKWADRRYKKRYECQQCV